MNFALYWQPSTNFINFTSKTIMAKYAYIRVSSDKQSYDQQIQDIKAYGINIADLDGVTEEKMTTNVGYVDREFNSLLKKCKAGDTIYAASTDRIGRDFLDMIKLMKDAKERGIEIIACKQNLSIVRDDVATRIIVMITAIMDEDEKKRIQHRTANKKAWQREQIAINGYFIIERGQNEGKACNYVGMPKWANMSDAQKCALAKAQETSIMARQDDAIEWIDKSEAVAIARRKRAEGLTLQQIVDELSCMFDDYAQRHPDEPNIYATRNGCKPSRGTISKWLRASNPLLVG